ncbi:MAG TPA: hypothetical protein VIC06_06545 [Solirubrobacteraceae bacterium]|jgi:hypothetical protein
MFKTKAALLGALGLMMVIGVAVSSAQALGPYWHVNGAKLTQGEKQVKVQPKGNLVFKGKIVALPFTMECAYSSGDNGAIEGNGNSQGQGKGEANLSECKSTSISKCAVEESVFTNQFKTHLVTFSGGQSKYAILLEPQQGTTLATITLINGSEKCVAAGEFPVTGSVAAEITPKEIETGEGQLNFPSTPITTVSLEGVERKISLTLGGAAASFNGIYGARLDGGETAGVFGT